MDLHEKFGLIKGVYFNGTIFDLTIKIESFYSEQSEESKNSFLNWLKFEFLAERLRVKKLQKEQKSKIKKFAGYEECVIGTEELNQKNKFLKKWVEEKKFISVTDKFVEIDLSNTSATEKIIYLQKLGVIEFLKSKQPFESSTNSLATVLSAITGEKAGTIQSMINPLLGKELEGKNNPMNSTKTVAKVESQLIHIGFQLNKPI